MSPMSRSFKINKLYCCLVFCYTLTFLSQLSSTAFIESDDDYDPDYDLEIDEEPETIQWQYYDNYDLTSDASLQWWQNVRNLQLNQSPMDFSSPAVNPADVFHRTGAFDKRYGSNCVKDVLLCR